MKSFFAPAGLSILLTMVTAIFSSVRASEPAPIPLWPGQPPGETEKIGEEKDMTKPTDGLIAGKPVIRLGNISNPTITVYRPSPEKNTGAAVVVFPGGGYNILALDLEGTEVCQWLNSIGVTGILLKYRVPKRADLPRHALPVQDAQRALGLLRTRAKEFGIDPQRIGVLGFSAGGHLAAALATAGDQRTYPPVDDADKTSCRPDFSILIYPGGIVGRDNTMGSEVQVSSNAPPTFIAMAENDPVRVENALLYATALKEAKVPFVLHVYSTGGHGYGLRRTKELVTTWPDRVAEWMENREWLKKN
jgi:acetyl esterase/lipase